MAALPIPVLLLHAAGIFQAGGAKVSQRTRRFSFEAFYICFFSRNGRKGFAASATLFFRCAPLRAFLPRSAA